MSASLFSAQDEQFMRRAIALAAQAEAQGEVPVGAVLVRDGEIIAEGWNGSITNHDATAHAEIEVIRKAGKALSNYRLLDTTLYVTLEPCPMCAGALLHSRVKRIVYGAPDLKAGAAGTVMDLFSSQAAYHYATVEKGCWKRSVELSYKRFFSDEEKRSKPNAMQSERMLRERMSGDFGKHRYRCLPFERYLAA